MKTKQCGRCKKRKKVSEFYAHKSRPTSKPGLGTNCKQCVKDKVSEWQRGNRTRLNARVRKWQQNNPEKALNYRRKTRYGMSTEQYEIMLNNQGGVCAICGRMNPSGKPLVIDHNHTTDKVRWLLCNRCNTGLGQFQDSPMLLRKAATMLEGA